MREHSQYVSRVAKASPIHLAAAFGLGLAVLVAGCSDGGGRMPTGPSAAAAGDSAVRGGNNQNNSQLAIPVVVDAGVCEQLTLSWNNPGDLAQTWHLEIWEIVSGARVDPKIYNNANYASASYTLAVPPGTYEVRITAKSTDPHVQNSGSASYFFTVLPCGSVCTLSQGHFKNNSAWPVSSLTLGTVSYVQSELQAILDQPVVGNGLISLAHQLITAKLNVARGADPSAVAAAIAAADALIGGLVVPPAGSGVLEPSATSALTTTLDQYNKGIIGPGHCE